MSPVSSGSSPTSGVCSGGVPPAGGGGIHPSPGSNQCLNSPAPPAGGAENVASMADSFVKWYYELLNATFYTSGCGAADGSDFGPQHFWVDASAKIYLHQGHPSGGGPGLLSKGSESSPSESICVQGGGQVCDALKHVVRKYRVTYHPNLSDAHGYMDAQGQAVLQAAGTLLNPSNSTVCGSFQQQFGLVRDPALGNNWKIKFTNASLVSKPETSHGISHGSNSQFQALASFDQSSAHAAMALS